MKLNSGFAILYNHFGFSPGGVFRQENDKKILVLAKKYEEQGKTLECPIIVKDKDSRGKEVDLIIYDEIVFE